MRAHIGHTTYVPAGLSLSSPCRCSFSSPKNPCRNEMQELIATKTAFKQYMLSIGPLGRPSQKKRDMKWIIKVCP